MELKTIISATMLTLAFGLANASTLPAVLALEMAKAMDINKDNMVSKDEFLAMMAKKYDEKMP